jgi:hypothetical protein
MTRGRNAAGPLGAFVLGLAVAGCGTVAHSRAVGAAGVPRQQAVSSAAVPRQPAAALQQAGDWATAYTYTLDSLRSCQVGDALTVIKDQARQPVRITAVKIGITGGAPGTERSSVNVIAVTAGSTTGALAPSFHLPHFHGRRVGSANGAVLFPVATSDSWYGIEIRLHVLGSHPTPWAITGLTVSYELSGRAHTAVFPQSVRLAPTTACPG